MPTYIASSSVLASRLYGDMASQVVGEGSRSDYEWPLYIRGYHEHKEVWAPTLGAAGTES